MINSGPVQTQQSNHFYRPMDHQSHSSYACNFFDNTESDIESKYLIKSEGHIESENSSHSSEYIQEEYQRMFQVEINDAEILEMKRLENRPECSPWPESSENSLQEYERMCEEEINDAELLELKRLENRPLPLLQPQEIEIEVKRMSLQPEDPIDDELYIQLTVGPQGLRDYPCDCPKGEESINNECPRHVQEVTQRYVRSIKQCQQEVAYYKEQGAKCIQKGYGEELANQLIATGNSSLNNIQWFEKRAIKHQVLAKDLYILHHRNNMARSVSLMFPERQSHLFLRMSDPHYHGSYLRTVEQWKQLAGLRQHHASAIRADAATMMPQPANQPLTFHEMVMMLPPSPPEPYAFDASDQFSNVDVSSSSEPPRRHPQVLRKSAPVETGVYKPLSPLRRSKRSKKISK